MSLGSGQKTAKRVLLTPDALGDGAKAPGSRDLGNRYRADIDGLRALAVASVVLFHAFPQAIKGGFIGVDVFFVISGFLISGHNFKELADGNFSFARFYARRVTRLFPALTVVLLTTWFFAWFLLFNDEFKQLGNHVSRAAIFLSNFILLHESGYFDTIAESKILLHLWSLAIEEQFYIVWPLILVAVWRLKRGRLLLLVAISAASFVWNGWLSLHDLKQDFYSPLARFWELSSGALLAYLPFTRGHRNLAPGMASFLSGLGIVLMITGICMLDSSVAFPGYWALIPVLASVLLIGAGPRAWVNHHVLSRPILTQLGLISYPLYLWHWPIFSLARVVNGESVPMGGRVILILISVGLAWLTYRLVETPVRFQIRHPRKTWILSLLMLLVGVLGYVTSKTDGFPDRDVMNSDRVFNQGDIGHEAFHRYSQEHFFPCEETRIASTVGTWNGMVRCFQSKKQKPIDLVLVGDSHAEHLFIGLAEAMPDANVAYYSKPALPLLGEAEFSTIFEVIAREKNYKTIVLTANWAPKVRPVSPEKFATDLNATVRTLLQAGKDVYLLSDIPQFQFDPQKCKYLRPLSDGVKCEMPRTIAQQQLAVYWSVIQDVQQKNPAMHSMDLTDFLCNPDVCNMASQGLLYYRDNNHLNMAGSRYVGRQIRDLTRGRQP
ncbi:MAG: acyltransferase [Betaproteobacteria bacterium]|nr:acyltransferase [Betaproteobacteria bacterium]